MLKLTMRVNNKNIGSVITEKDSEIGQLSATQVSALLAALTLKSSIQKDNYGPDLDEDRTVAQETSITRLSSTKLLASAQCWSGAYNVGIGYWIIDAKSPFHPALVTDSGSDLSGSEILASHKGCGRGDCWSSNSWTWDGKQFVHAAASTTGMCKCVAVDGAWSLPRIVTQVR